MKKDSPRRMDSLALLGWLNPGTHDALCPRTIRPHIYDDLPGTATVADRIPLDLEISGQRDSAQPVKDLGLASTVVVGAGAPPIAVPVIHLGFNEHRCRVKLATFNIALEFLHAGNALDRFVHGYYS